MKKKCSKCKGTGSRVKKRITCHACDGTGFENTVEIKDHFKGVTSNAKSKFDLETEQDVPCDVCNGTGKIEIFEECKSCNGTGEINVCKSCGILVKEPYDYCKSCLEDKKKREKIEKEKKAKNKQKVYVLSSLSEMSDLEKGPIYKGKITRVEKYGVFVSLSNNVWGLMRTGNPQYNVGDEIFIKISEVKLHKREVDMNPARITGEYELVKVKKNINRTQIGALENDALGKVVKIEGEILQIQQTTGPTIFTIADDTSITWAAAFNEPGIRVYPNIENGDIVEVIGEVNQHSGKIQIESEEIQKLEGNQEEEMRNLINKSLDERAEPESVDLLIESSVLDKLHPKMVEAAKTIRRAIIDGRSILVRHHADADGICAGVAMEKAIVPLLVEHNLNNDAEWHYFKRSPSKAPFYELEDVVKDLSYALEDLERHGQKLPLIVLLDNGSTEEDVLALMKVKIYGIEIVVIDHHFPGEVVDGKVEVDDYVDVHVNPYLVGGDSQITAGALAVEVAHIINPEIKKTIEHLPGIAALGDHASSKEADDYVAIAGNHGFSREYLDKIAACVDFEAYYLRFMNGRGLMDTILAVDNVDKHEKLINVLFNEYQKRVDTQLKACLPNLKRDQFDNGIRFNMLDVEKFAHRFTFPAPGKTCGFVHDAVVQEYGEDTPILTLSYGPDFGVIRATDAVNETFGFNLNEIIWKLADKIPEAGIDGGGHEVAGSIKFIEGLSDEVLNAFINEIKNL
ncbi:DHH family phosphoesterase [Methanobrevibacter filiformis]|uniref:DHH family protein n=1 Tax=Methanobrevibacter filiformis TaxID=55758 RepID=A0A166BLF4_9EURY|nr:DHH family phosphoesterase [Methanobrevibacter filiformis]KZX13523.1 DHH family protein [Methanobrevibacter filiformis]